MDGLRRIAPPFLKLFAMPIKEGVIAVPSETLHRKDACRSRHGWLYGVFLSHLVSFYAEQGE